MSAKRTLTPEQREEAEKKRRFEERRNRDDLKKILATPEGQRYIIRLVTRCGIWRAEYEGNGSRAYFDAGIRRVGTEVAREVAAIKPELLIPVLTPAVPPTAPTEAEEEFDDHGE